MAPSQLHLQMPQTCCLSVLVYKTSGWWIVVTYCYVYELLNQWSNVVSEGYGKGRTKARLYVASG
jgi:hypothetical protein